MKKYLVFLILILSPSFTIAENINNKLRLGFVVPLSGPLAFFGKDLVRSVDMAIEAKPEIKNNIEILWEDSAYDSKQAISAFNKLVSSDKVDIVYSFGGPMLSALAPVAESKQIPFFASESEKKDCMDRNFCTLFRNEEEEWGRAFWDVLREEGKKNILIVKNQNQFMNTLVNAVIKTKNEDETVEVFLDVPFDTTEFRTTILPLKAKKFDSLGIFLLPGSHHGFMKALKIFNKKFHFIGVEEFFVPEQNKGLDSIMEKALVIAPSSTDSYRELFEKKFGYSAGFFYTPACYDFVNLLNENIENNPALRGKELVAAMRSNQIHEGVSGKYKIVKSEKGVYSYSFPIGIYEVVNGKVAHKRNIEF